MLWWNNKPPEMQLDVKACKGGYALKPGMAAVCPVRGLFWSVRRSFLKNNNRDRVENKCNRLSSLIRKEQSCCKSEAGTTNGDHSPGCLFSLAETVDS